MSSTRYVVNEVTPEVRALYRALRRAGLGRSAVRRIVVTSLATELRGQGAVRLHLHDGRELLVP